MSHRLFDWLQKYQSNQPNFGLERMKKLLSLLGNPEQNVPVIHIAGTNGKGSTAATLNQLLQNKKLKIGSFSSPYIIDYCEQLSINGTAISKDRLEELLLHLKELLETSNQRDWIGLTEFEIITALAFDYFSQEQVDLALIEVGMGGRLDSTNVCHPFLTAITTIGLDHVALLGNTLPEIAKEKAGIIKENIPVVTGNIPIEAYQVIKSIAQQNNSRLLTYQADYSCQWLVSKPNGEEFSYQSLYRPKTTFVTALLGKHQVENTALAITLADLACHEIGLSPLSIQEIQDALYQTSWPARMENISQDPLILLDGAHNPHAMTRLVDNLNERYEPFQKQILFSCIQTKNIEQMLHQLLSLEKSHLTLTTFEDKRAFSKKQMQTLAKETNTTYQDWSSFLTDYLTKKPLKNEILVITGSLYFLSQVRYFLQTSPLSSNH